MIVFNATLRTVPIKEIVGAQSMPILRDHYIYQMPWSIIEEKYGLNESNVYQLKMDIARYITYTLRRENYYLSPMLVIYHDDYLKTLVWYEFIKDQLEGGKTTIDISEDTGRNLKEINGYL